MTYPTSNIDKVTQQSLSFNDNVSSESWLLNRPTSNMDKVALSDLNNLCSNVFLASKSLQWFVGWRRRWEPAILRPAPAGKNAKISAFFLQALSAKEAIGRHCPTSSPYSSRVSRPWSRIAAPAEICLNWRRGKKCGPIMNGTAGIFSTRMKKSSKISTPPAGIPYWDCRARLATMLLAVAFWHSSLINNRND